MKKIMKKILMALFINLFTTSLVLAASPADEAKIAKTMVEEAVAFFNANGKDKTLTEISNPSGKWVKGELYVFAYDLNGVVIAHPINPKLIGKNLIDVPDAAGKTFRKDIAEVARTKGTGWVDYKYKNPATNKIEDKSTFLMKVSDVIICCGIYK
jgi:signal transduction histidine kinase